MKHFLVLSPISIRVKEVRNVALSLYDLSNQKTIKTIPKYLLEAKIDQYLMEKLIATKTMSSSSFREDKRLLFGNQFHHDLIEKTKDHAVANKV